MIDFSIFVKKLLLDKRMTQYQLGEKLGMSKTMASHYLSRDDFRINADIARIADALGYDIRLQLIDRQTDDIIDVK